MTEEEKQLLFKDLVARLPYTPMVNLRGKAGYDRKLVSVHRYTTRNEFEIVVNSDDDEDYMPHNFEIEIVKPYLRPMSSMTEDERKELSNLVNNELNGNQEDDDCLPWVLYDSTGIKNQTGGERFYFNEMSIIYDWFNEHHFDYRGLIGMGLALPAPKGMYDIKK